MIFYVDNIKPSKEYTMPIGKCPICDKDAELISSSKEINSSYHVIHSNEYYRHMEAEDGITYVQKRKNVNYPKF